MKNNKTRWIITFATLLLIAGGGLTVKFWPRTVPFEQCSPIYRIFANQPGIKASYVKDYPINDSVYVNTTLLEAIDSVEFEQLKKDMFYKLNANNGEKYAWLAYLCRENFKLPADSANKFNNDLAFYGSNTPHSIAIFHIETEEQIMAILDKQLAFLF